MGINIIMALSLYITYKTGQISLGHAGFMAIGAYVSSILTVNFGFNLIIAIVIGGIITTIFGILAGLPVLKMEGMYLAIATIAFNMIVQVFFNNFKYTGASRGFFGMKGTNLLNVYLLVIIIIYIFWKIDNSRFGRAFEAIKQDKIVAGAMGINTATLKLISFAMGSFVAGIGGALEAHHVFFIDAHQFGYSHSVNILFFLIIGGGETIIGPVLGAIILTVLPELLRVFSDYRMFLYGISLILIMILRPQGLIDRKLLSNFFKFKKGNA